MRQAAWNGGTHHALPALRLACAQSCCAREDAEDITWCPECEPLPKDGVLRLGWEQWVRMFKPIKNFIDQNASVDGYMFETSGPEYEAVAKARSKILTQSGR